MRFIFLYIISVLCAMVALTGCHSTQYIPVESTRVDSIYLYKLTTDTILCKDSTFVKEKGDTTVIEKYKYVYKVRERIDTVYKEKFDSIQVPYTVEKTLSRWEKAKMDLGGIAIGAFALAMILLIIQVVKAYKK